MWHFLVNRKQSNSINNPDFWHIFLSKIDLEDISTAQLRKMLEARLETSLTSYKRFIDAEMLNILGQLDSPSCILEDFLYLGSEWNASNLEELTQNKGKGGPFMIVFMLK